MLEVVPITLKEANAFVEQNHRHHGPTVGHKFSIGLSDGEKNCGRCHCGATCGPSFGRRVDAGSEQVMHGWDPQCLFNAICRRMESRPRYGV